MIRFCRNSKLEKSCRITDILTPDELKEAEKRILLIVQRTSFVSDSKGGSVAYASEIVYNSTPEIPVQTTTSTFIVNKIE
ncbi:hypothetical protein CEXT_550031 [Caerostris extrusa]|uniref:Uncharacterized protein n=1 Tax=Caerostris extrusa TaxID=172846 RepID=A0AAV4TCQ0_CAEEX|nr:hypothetical protein CEXT_550031 [Caerostris extrusa]